MKNILYTLSLVLFSLSVAGQSKTEEKQRDSEFYKAADMWFSAWELVSKDIYKIDNVQAIDFVFFDDKYVYSTSDITIKNGSIVKGCNLMNLQLKWKKTLHNDSLTLPNKSVVSVKLMSFASPITEGDNQAFFVMPLPSFWQKAGVTSKELGLENLVTGVFLHEFSHSQQMQNFGKRISEYDKSHNFGIPMNDDILQGLFSKDSTYQKDFHKENDIFYSSLHNNSLDKKKVKNGLDMMKQRQTKYFVEKYKDLREMDDFFLTMEGFGQYSMYAWLVDSRGANIKKDIAIEGIRRSKTMWSQEEGLALFLILEKLNKPENWGKTMVSDKVETVIKLIDESIK